MKLCLPAIVLGAALLAGCATTDVTREGSGSIGADDGGYYVAAHDGFGDYYYDRPQLVTNYDPWNFGAGYGWYGSSGFGFAPWSYGYPFWFGIPPWYWHHHHPGHHAEDVAVARADIRPDPAPGHRPRPAPVAFPDLHDREIRAPHHGFQHSRP